MDWPLSLGLFLYFIQRFMNNFTISTSSTLEHFLVSQRLQQTERRFWVLKRLQRLPRDHRRHYFQPLKQHWHHWNQQEDSAVQGSEQGIHRQEQSQTHAGTYTFDYCISLVLVLWNVQCAKCISIRDVENSLRSKCLTLTWGHNYLNLRVFHVFVTTWTWEFSTSFHSIFFSNFYSIFYLDLSRFKENVSNFNNKFFFYNLLTL